MKIKEDDMEEVLQEMKAQTALLKDLNANVAGLLEARKTEGKEAKEAAEKGMRDALAQVSSALKGTPLEGTPLGGMMADIIKKAGGRTSPPAA